MSFFEDKKDEVEETEEQVEEQAEEVVEEKITLGENEYSQDELKELVNLGKIGKEAEEKYNTSIDKVWPEYSRKE